MSYQLDNAQPESTTRMDVLSRLFDPRTHAVLESVGVAEGWHCLEIGGGGGSIARWLSRRVGAGGSVLCTDIDPRHICRAPGQHSNLRVERHDIASDPLPAGRFDLIHARLVMIHVPERWQVLRKLCAALAPGGWLVIEDFDAASLLECEPVPGETRFASMAAMRTFLERGGSHARTGRELHAQFRRLGLADVRSDGMVSMYDAGHPGAALLRLNFEQIGPRAVARGLLSGDELRRDLGRLDRDDWVTPSPILWSVIGRKSAAHRGHEPRDANA